MTGIGAALALSLVTGFHGPPAVPGPADAAGTDVVAIGTDPLDRMTVPVAIGTHGTFRFLIDTGAQNTVISDTLAASLALKPSAQARVIGTAGERTVDAVRLDGLMLGTRSFDGLFAPLLHRSDIGADGVVGLDSLQHQRVLIDFPHNLITVSDADDKSDPDFARGSFEIVVRARRQSGQLIVTNATIDGVRVAVVLDTGANVTIGNPALAAALARRGPLSTATLHSITGQDITAGIGMTRKLVIDRLTIGNVPVAYAAAPPFAYLGLEHRPAILLGMSELRAFKRVGIDFSRRKVMFKLADTAALAKGG